MGKKSITVRINKKATSEIRKYFIKKGKEVSTRQRLLSELEKELNIEGCGRYQLLSAGLYLIIYNNLDDFSLDSHPQNQYNLLKDEAINIIWPKMGESKKKPNNKGLWEGNSYSQMLRRPEWKEKREEVLESHGRKCEICGVIQKRYHIHHKEYRKGALPWDYPLDNFMVLCGTCHRKVHDIDENGTKKIPLDNMDDGFMATDRQYFIDNPDQKQFIREVTEYELAFYKEYDQIMDREGTYVLVTNVTDGVRMKQAVAPMNISGNIIWVLLGLIRTHQDIQMDLDNMPSIELET